MAIVALLNSLANMFWLAVVAILNVDRRSRSSYQALVAKLLPGRRRETGPVIFFASLVYFGAPSCTPPVAPVEAINFSQASGSANQMKPTRTMPYGENA